MYVYKHVYYTVGSRCDVFLLSILSRMYPSRSRRRPKRSIASAFLVEEFDKGQRTNTTEIGVLVGDSFDDYEDTMSNELRQSSRRRTAGRATGTIYAGDLEA